MVREIVQVPKICLGSEKRSLSILMGTKGTSTLLLYQHILLAGGRTKCQKHGEDRRIDGDAEEMDGCH